MKECDECNVYSYIYKILAIAAGFF